MPLEFPKESIDLAKHIAKQYNLRRETMLGKLDMLYDGAFLHIGYGFDDALKEGKPALFLHEMTTRADCDSYAGALYLIAKELNAKPKIYSAYGMKQIHFGQDLNDSSSGNHTFITAQVGDKTYLIDPFYQTYARAKINGNHIELDINDPKRHAVNFERVSNMLVEMSEQEYLKRIYSVRQNGGREALNIGRRINSHHRRVALEYIEKDEILSSSITTDIIPNLIDRDYSRCRNHFLNAKVLPDGKWDIDNGELLCFSSSMHGWTFDQFENIHSMMKIPYVLAKEYVDNLRTAVKYSGRKTLAEDIRTNDIRKYFISKGFSTTGDLVSENGVDKIAHRKLLDEIVKYFPTSEPSIVQPFLHQVAAFNYQKEKDMVNGVPKNIYSEAEHAEFVKTHCDLLKKYFQAESNLEHNVLLASGGLLSDFVGRSKDLQKHRNSMSSEAIFKYNLSHRKKSLHVFDRNVDFALFQKEHPVGTIKATSEELDFHYRRLLFGDMTLMVFYQRSIEVRDKRKGLEKLLGKK